MAPGGVPIGWGALSGLSADTNNNDRLWSISDSYYSPTRLFSISTSDRSGHDGGPAIIRAALTLTENGQPLGVDGEGIAARQGGGFWLAVEGEDGPGNQILQVDDSAAVQRRIPLPAEVSGRLTTRGLEGIAVTGTGPSEAVYVALQSPLATVSSSPAETGIARIGRYQVATGTWSWYGYPLDAGSNVGLSELVALGGNRFAVLERDNLSGPTAAVKRIYTVDLDEASGTGLPLLTKTLARDLLPDLRATNGWVQEKVEGLTIGGDRRVYLVTDNDGVDEATGETVFLDLGQARRIFGR